VSDRQKEGKEEEEEGGREERQEEGEKRAATRKEEESTKKEKEKDIKMQMRKKSKQEEINTDTHNEQIITPQETRRTMRNLIKSHKNRKLPTIIATWKEAGKSSSKKAT